MEDLEGKEEGGGLLESHLYYLLTRGRGPIEPNRTRAPVKLSSHVFMWVPHGEPPEGRKVNQGHR